MTIKIPVSCVEQGRWRYKSRYFGPSGAHSPVKLRRALKASVSKSVTAKRGYRSDHGEVWKEVACLQAVHGVKSGTAAMSEAFETYQECIAAYREKVKYIDGSAGVAVAIGDRVVSVDVFDKPSTCQKVWERILSGLVFDALEAGETDKAASVKDVEQLIAVVVDLPWEPVESVGEGEEYRAESKRGDHASALSFHDTMVHGSAVAAI